MHIEYWIECYSDILSEEAAKSIGPFMEPPSVDENGVFFKADIKDGHVARPIAVDCEPNEPDRPMLHWDGPGLPEQYDHVRVVAKLVMVLPS